MEKYIFILIAKINTLKGKIMGRQYKPIICARKGCGVELNFRTAYQVGALWYCNFQCYLKR